MAMPFGMAGRRRPAGPGKDNGDMEQAIHCLDVWEWEGGAGGSVDAALDPHATLNEYHPPERRGGALLPWRLLTAARRALRPRVHWAGLLALGAGVVGISLLRR